ncbi:MAG: outer membrane beta-barrel protein [Deltaproteobacteria bacterium]|nr:outer membrane beta-barrel protein [Deltaproteobacteria bacterium]
MNRFWIQIPLAVLLATIFTLPAHARIKSFGGKLQVGGNVGLAFAGDTLIKQNGTDIRKIFFGYDTDLDVTAGMNFHAVYEVFKYIDVGGQFNFMFFRDKQMKKAGDTRNSLVEFNFIVRGKYGFLNDALHIYLSFPIGLSISIPSKDTKNNFKNANITIKTGAGVNLSVLAGIDYAFWKGLGAFFEMGYRFVYINNKADPNLEYEQLMSQMAMNFGMFYRF